MGKSYIIIHPSDNAAVALRDLAAGEVCGGITVTEDIPAGHKFAVCDIPSGEKIVKYGSPIGTAACFIRKGAHIHTHNARSDLSGVLTYSYRPDFSDPEPKEPSGFVGFRRKNGKVGIRNEIWIIPTVGCVNGTVRELEKAAQAYISGSVDSVVSFNHPHGCSQLGGDCERTLKFLSGLIKHPNAGGVLVVGLGCENGNIDELKKVLGVYDPDRVKFLIAQDCTDEIEEGLRLLKELCEAASEDERTPCPSSELVIGLKCGGSDGLSGITANPLLGRISDRLVSEGGSTILTEVPEMFGAETLLMKRCRDESVFRATVDLINGFKEYYIRYGEKIDENPSPGNKKGGITTLEDKSLGCTQKGGSSPVEDVLGYGGQIRRKGLSLLCAPGNDLVASCALAASGAHIVLFTTGRGTPFTCPVPTLKIASNRALAEKKRRWIDFDASRVLDEDEGEVTGELFRLILDTASGKKAVGESLDRCELAIFKDGVTL